MKTQIVSFTSGLIFAIGLVVSGMTNPDKVKGFLDIFGNWDYTLVFVMGGAVAINFFAFKFLKSRKPLFADAHFLPTSTDIDKRLILGSALFGIGWGIVGVCPGPALVNLATLDSSIIIFIFAMLAGMGLYKLFDK